MFLKRKNVFIRAAILTVTLWLSSSQTPAYALIQDYIFDGLIAESAVSFIPVNSSFYGSFSIDFDAPLAVETASSSTYQQALLNMKILFNGGELIFYPVVTAWSVRVGDSSIRVEDLPGQLAGRVTDIIFGFNSATSFPDHTLKNAWDIDKMIAGAPPYDYGDYDFDAGIYGLEGSYMSEVQGNFIHIEKVYGPTPAPEPSTLVMLCIGFIGLAAYGKIRRGVA